MYLFYVDETGNRDPRIQIPCKDGSTKEGDWLYVLTAVCLFEHRWHGFEKTINRFKRQLIENIRTRGFQRLDLVDCEIKSNWIRIPKERNKHIFLKNITDSELNQLIELYYNQLHHRNMYILSVIVDKRYLHNYMDDQKIHRKSWELLLEQVEKMMRAKWPKHQAIMVNDDICKQVNCSLAMKHAYLLEEGTSNNTWLKHLCEMPMFVRSELSNGVQLADLCSYNIYRAFKEGDLSYPFFEKIKPWIWSKNNLAEQSFSGIWVFPGNSPLRSLVEQAGL